MQLKGLKSSDLTKRDSAMQNSSQISSEDILWVALGIVCLNPLCPSGNLCHYVPMRGTVRLCEAAAQSPQSWRPFLILPDVEILSSSRPYYCHDTFCVLLFHCFRPTIVLLVCCQKSLYRNFIEDQRDAGMWLLLQMMLVKMNSTLPSHEKRPSPILHIKPTNQIIIFFTRE